MTDMTVKRGGLNGTAKISESMRSVHGRLSPQLKKVLRTVIPVDFMSKLAFPVVSDPTVSVIIPVYGAWEQTWRCLESLTRVSNLDEIEIIVVDDKSPDNTLKKLREIPGIRVLAMPRNVGFIKACNAGIDVANGEYICFLNNDTVVDSEWLVALLSAMEDPSVGLAGSKLIFPNGMLQEAGGVIFSDGSGWNYGRGRNPADHSFNYIRDVDYCSGASLMVRTHILRELNGFDERYVPAYYEDTDLAFEVRELGYRTVYQPMSVVVHFEGVSNGTDVTEGVKRFQEINREKFRVKWKKQLRDQPLGPSGDTTFEIERCVHGRNVVFVADDHVPTPDLDSGSLRMSRILLKIKELGFEPILVPQSPERHDPWAEWFGQQGIQTLYRTNSVHGYTDISPDLMAELLKGHVKVLFLSRTGVSSAFMYPFTHALPSAKVVFDTVDLHGLREAREAELSNDPALAVLARRTEQAELGLMRASDVTLVVSTVEKAILDEKYPDLDIQVIANVHDRVKHKVGVDGRDGIAFIGSFQHKPNADGIKWYLEEVDPIIRRTHPDLSVRIYGKNPPKELRDIADPNVRFMGYVEDLADVYDDSRVSFAPLRYGAGVKGKVGEALSWGSPIVTTSIGAEGMGLTHGETAWIADSPEDFAAGLIELNENDELWEELSVAGEVHIETAMGDGALEEALLKLFSTLEVEVPAKKSHRRYR